MKKRLSFIITLIAVVLTLLIPGTVLAGGNTVTMKSGFAFSELVGKDLTKITFHSNYTESLPSGIILDTAEAGTIVGVVTGTELDIYCNDAIAFDSTCYYMFSEMAALTVIENLADVDTGNVTKVSGMFYNCSSLTDLDVSGFDTGNVTDMCSMFEGCSSLTDLDVSGFDTGNVTYMGFMFYACSSLTDLDVSGFDTGNVTNMNFMFGKCSSLTDLDVSGFDTENVTNMSYMFYECSSLTSLDLSSFNTNNVNDAKAMFTYCSSLKEIKLGENWTFNGTIGSRIEGMNFPDAPVVDDYTGKWLCTEGPGKGNSYYSASVPGGAGTYTWETKQPKEPTTEQTTAPTTEQTTAPTTEEPTAPTTEQTTAPQDNNPPTGDSNNAWIYILIAVLALGTALGAGIIRKKANK